MKKILISSLGTGQRGRYNEANYEIDGKIYQKQRSISRVLCENLSIDKLFLIGTKQSIWEVAFSEFGGDLEMELKIYEEKENDNLDKYLSIIEQQIDRSLGTIGSKCFIIEYGINEAELWRNFAIFLKIAKDFANNDEIHLDITHSFRSLALMSFVMNEFISNSQETPLNIKGVYYGMFEFSKENDNVTPIVNLSMFFELLRWSKAIRVLKLYGNSREILALIQENNDEKSLKNAFASFSNASSMSDMTNLNLAVKNLKTKLKLFKESKNKIFNLISDELESFVKELDVENFAIFQYRLALWYADNENYALSYIVLAEAIVSAICYKNGLDFNAQNDRKTAQNELFNECKNKNKIAITYSKVCNIRNSIAHALDKNAKKTNISSVDAIKNLPLYIDSVKELFKGKI